jgi:hypothetical protein
MHYKIISYVISKTWDNIIASKHVEETLGVECEIWVWKNTYPI